MNDSMHKAIINFTPTGMIPTYEKSPFACIEVNDIIETVLQSRDYGVSMVHLHARDKKTFEPTWKAEVYDEIVRGIRKYDKEIILIVSTSGRNWSEFEKRSACLEIEGVDMASLSTTSVNFNNQASVNSPDMIKRLALEMKERGIKPELECFDVGAINYAKYLYKKNYIDSPFFFTFILGNIACAQANILNLAVMKNELPDNSFFVTGGVGDSQFKMNIEGLLNANGVRVGLEDMLFFSEKRDKLCTNIELLERVKSIIERLELNIASSKDVRCMLKLKDLA